MPVMLMTIFGVTGYLSDGTFLIEYKDSYFAYSQMDLVMSGGCTPCHVICKRVLHQMATFNHEALMSKPTFEDLYTATSWDYSILSAEALALADRLDASGAICSGGVDEWGSPLSIITGEAEEVVEIIDTLNLSVTPLEYAELKKGVETKSECITKWAVEGHLRLFMFQAQKGSIDYSSIPAADFNVYPEYADSRSGVQKLDRYFRLTWEFMQVLITTTVASVLYSSYLTSLPFIVDYNGKLLRKTTKEGAEYCGLHDSPLCGVVAAGSAVLAQIPADF
ncbi:hypothetical protein BBJ29_002741 [Phytophthora kernoviae]|uniref:Uncharacterized protein n=1 Tax=Phytophthora kernoviae TaxID=325452 RepID=A0A421FRB7_9STRA|nr:hypothetical protein BBJ29_002741 [Phytophthora kernoviae]